MTAFILFALATAEVKGFAFTLGIGTLVSLFTAVLATQAALGAMGRSRLVTPPGRARRRARAQRLDVRLHGRLEVVLLAVGHDPADRRARDRRQRPQLRHRLQVRDADPERRSSRPRATKRSRQSAERKPAIHNAEVQKITDASIGGVGLPDLDQDTRADRRLEGRSGARHEVRRSDPRRARTPDFSSTSIGPTFGKTVANSAVIAIIASLLVISAYIALRFEWKYAVPVLIALMHDLLITAGVYALDRPGGDDRDGRGAADDPRVFALRHDHRVRPRPRERAAHAAARRSRRSSTARCPRC